MKHWTLFTLRMTARIGLALTVVLWLTSHWIEMWGSLRPGTVYCRPQTSSAAVGLFWTEWSPLLSDPAWSGYITIDVNEYPPSEEFNDLNIPHTGRLVVFARAGFIEVHHWFLCLTFLIATIATSVRWRKPGAGQNGSGRCALTSMNQDGDVARVGVRSR